MPVLFQGWFTSSKEVYVIGNLFSIWLNLHRILQNEDFCLSLVQPVQAVSNEKVAESVMLIDAFLPTDYYSYGKSYIYLGWFLFKHLHLRKVSERPAETKKIKRVEEKEVLTYLWRHFYRSDTRKWADTFSGEICGNPVKNEVWYFILRNRSWSCSTFY